MSGLHYGRRVCQCNRGKVTAHIRAVHRSRSALDHTRDHIPSNNFSVTQLNVSHQLMLRTPLDAVRD